MTRTSKILIMILMIAFVGILTGCADKEYTFKVELIDAHTPDRYLTVYEYGKVIVIKELMYEDDVKIPVAINDTKVSVSNSDIFNQTTLKVKLKNGKVVTANLEESK